MAIYDGFVSTDEGDVHVILGVGQDRVTMSSNGSEIGEWLSDDVDVSYVGEGVYLITAEDESLRFTPNDPNLFGLAFDGPESIEAPGEPAAGTISTPEATTTDAPEPRTTTKGLFYALAAITAALGLWALVSMLVG